MWHSKSDRDWQRLETQFDWVKRMAEVPQDPRHHAEGDVSIHTRMVIAALENEPGYQQLAAGEQDILWAAALLHDVEKYSTTVTEPDGSITANGHARKGAQKAREILYKEVPAPFAIREQVVALVRHHGLPLWALEKPDPVRSLATVSLEVNTQWLALLAKADALGRICTDQADLLYRIDCFEEFCREQHCWSSQKPFASPHARLNYFQKTGTPADYVPYDVPATAVVMMSGLPGAGKDTYIRRHFREMPVISLDGIRRERKIAPTDKTGNGQVIQEAKEQARVLLRAKKPFVWNATNITRQMRQQLIDLFLTYKAEVKIVYVEVPFAELQKQNKSREEMVPAGVLERLAAKLEVPAAWEAHEVVYEAGPNNPLNR